MDWLTIQSYMIEHAQFTWLIIGFMLIATELSVAPGVGILFAGVAAISLGGLLTFDIIILHSLSSQLMYFSGLTVFWAIVLWIPMKRYLRSSTSKFDIYAGTFADVLDGGLEKGTLGRVRWSGTVMRARITDNAQVDKIEANTQVYVHTMKNGVLSVDTTPCESDEQE